MTATSRRLAGPGSEDELITAAIVGVGLLAFAGVGLLWADAQLVHAFDGGPAVGNPIRLVGAVVTGGFPLRAAHAWAGGALLVIMCVAAVPVLLAVGRARGRRSRVDRAATVMGRGRDVDALTRAPREFATRHQLAAPGLPVGITVADGARVWQDWESVAVHIWGPRQGKTTCEAIPALMAAPGAVIATSNKPDLLGHRPGRVFDPQGIADTEPTWWWNPLTYVTDEVQAMKLSRVLVGAARDPGAKVDAYFDKAGPSLISGMLLAAAHAGRPISQVYEWLTNPLDEEPALLLEHAGYRLQALAVRGVIDAPEKQRGGVYGTAQELMSFLLSRRALTWVEPQPGRPGLNVHDFVHSTDALFLLSREGEASTGPLVAALTAAICEAAEQAANSSPGGRLPVPMTVVLDEAANICRWHALPDLYSHYGSKGIVLITFLQSWSQGVGAWGRDGMTKMWSAANVKVVGSGVAEDGFLEGVSKMIGAFDLTAHTRSRSRQGTSTSTAVRRERILEVADLAALPRGRAVVLAAGARPALIRTVPWGQR